MGTAAPCSLIAALCPVRVLSNPFTVRRSKIHPSPLRIFYRNAMNIGLPLLECEDAVLATAEGDELEVDLMRGRIVNRSKGTVFTAVPLPLFIQDLISAGGLLQHIRKTLS